MRSPKPFLVLSLTALIALISVTVWLFYPRNITITESEFQGVIFHEANAADELGFMLTKEGSEEAYWTPGKTEILNIEKQLITHTQEQLPSLSSRLSRYKRQYFGFIRGERDLVFIVGFCQPVNVEWSEQLVSMPLAADCYFEAQYDMAGGHFLYVWERTAR